MKIICFIKGIFKSLCSFQIVSGCNFVEKYDNEDIQILECEFCGKISVGYKS